MSKREKIIVGLMVAAIVFGAYNFLFSGSADDRKKGPGKAPVGVNEFVADLVKRIRSADTTAADARILKSASAAWKKDPFQVVKKETASAEKAQKKTEIIDREELAGAFTYSGYMEMGKRRLAIINGMEYQTGDQLETPGAVLKKIAPGKVYIYVAAEKGIIVVPLDELAGQ